MVNLLGACHVDRRRVIGDDSGQMVDRFAINVIDQHQMIRHPRELQRRLPELGPGCGLANWNPGH
jgi:hypothetical protein